MSVHRSSDDRDLARWALQALWPQRRRVLPLLLLGGVSAALDLVMPLTLAATFRVLQQGAGTEDASAETTLVALLAVALLLRPLAWLAHAAVANVGMHARFSGAVRQHSIARVLQRPLVFFQSEMTGRIVSHVLRVGPALRSAVVLSVATAWQLVFFSGVAIGLLRHQHGLLALPIGVWIAGTALLLAVTTPQLHRSAQAAGARQSMLSGQLYEVFAAMFTVLSFGRTVYETRLLDRAQQEVDAAAARQMRITTLQGFLLSLLNAGMVVGTTIIGLWLWRHGQVDGSALALALPLAWQASAIAWGLAGQTSGLLDSLAGLREAAPTVAAEPPPASRAGAPLVVNRGDIECCDVHFGYHPDIPVIDGLHLRVSAGEHVGLVGPSGSGKSTLAALLTGLQTPVRGSVLLDGQDLAQADAESIRQGIGLVPQDTVLFFRSLRDNIAYGRPEATDAEVQRAAACAGAAGFIARQVDAEGRAGYDCQVGERGARLSGGQRQRIALARAFVQDARVLVLDEATNALDPASEREVLQTLRQCWRGRTLVVISHRLEATAGFDRLVVMSDGRIVEDGQHTSLLTAGGSYAALWRRHQDRI